MHRNQETMHARVQTQIQNHCTKARLSARLSLQKAQADFQVLFKLRKQIQEDGTALVDASPVADAGPVSFNA